VGGRSPVNGRLVAARAVEEERVGLAVHIRFVFSLDGSLISRDYY
jgi:hypothetical protein